MPSHRRSTHRPRSHIVLAALAIVAAGLSPARAGAQDAYPSRRITMVVPFPAGAATDSIARSIAQDLTKAWGQPVTVENRAGATGSIGSAYVAHAAPDGYTLLVNTTSSHTMGPNLLRQKSFDPIKDFKPVTLLVWAPNVLVVNPRVPARSVKDLIALAKQEPGKLDFASSGTGSSIDLAAEMFDKEAGIRMTHVPYKGAAPAIADLLGGQVDLMFDTVAEALPHIRSGKLRALGVTTTHRSPSLPDVPTIAEAGLPGYEMAAWIGLMAPAGTPDAIVDKLNRQIAIILDDPALRARIVAQGMEPAPSTPAMFEAQIVREVPKYATVIKEAGIQPE